VVWFVDVRFISSWVGRKGFLYVQHKRWQSSPSEHSVDSIGNGIGPTNGTVVAEFCKDARLSEAVGVDG
jgi:hypothetical protein